MSSMVMTIEKPPNILIELPPPPLPPPPVISLSSNFTVQKDNTISLSLNNIISFNNRVEFLFNKFKQNYYDSLMNEKECKYIKKESFDYLDLIYNENFDYPFNNSELIQNFSMNAIKNETNNKISITPTLKSTRIFEKYLPTINDSILNMEYMNNSKYYDKSNNYTILDKNFTNSDNHHNDTYGLDFELKMPSSNDIYQLNRSSTNLIDFSAQTPNYSNMIWSLFNMNGLFLPLIIVIFVCFVSFFALFVSKKSKRIKNSKVKNGISGVSTSSRSSSLDKSNSRSSCCVSSSLSRVNSFIINVSSNLTTPPLAPLPPPPPPPLSTLPKSTPSDYYEDYDDSFAQTNKNTHNISYYKSDTCDNLKNMANTSKQDSVSTISDRIDTIYSNNKANYDAIFSNYQNSNLNQSLSTFGKGMNNSNSSKKVFLSKAKNFESSLISQSYENKNVMQLSNSYYLSKANYYNSEANNDLNGSSSKIFPRTNPNYSKIYGIKVSQN